MLFTLEPAEPSPGLEAAWKRFDATGPHSFFVTWTWIGTWLSLLPAEFRPFLLRAESGGETVAMAVLVPRRERRLRVIAASQLHFNSTGERGLDCITIEHNGFAAGQAAGAALWQDFLDWFRAGAAPAEELVVPGIEGQLARSLDSGGLIRTGRDAPAFRAALRGTAPKERFDAGLSRNARQQLRRAMRDYRAIGELRIDEAKSPETALSYFAALKALHIRSWIRRGKAHAFRYPFFEKFHRALIVRGVPEGTVRMLRISAGTEPIGYLYNFRRNGVIYAYQSGFEDADPGLHPGYVSHALAIEAAQAEGSEVYDFMAGTNRLKQSFGRETYCMSWFRLARPALRFRAENVLRLAARTLLRR